jgi:hypothetical protein
MAILEIAKIQVRRGQENQTGIPQLAPGEFGWAEDTEHLYIGKRISEGATNDNNSRILTEHDKADIIDQLGGIFSTFRPHSQDATTSTYKYRDGVDFIHSSISSVAIKSDNTVNLTDYDVRVSSTATDITTKFRLAVNDLFKNSNWDDLTRRDARRKLIVPAGHYLINDVIDLPPYTSIEGEGQELTTLTLMSTITNMFRTVDAEGHTYESGMSGGVKRARQVTIKGMTLQYSTSTNNTKSPSLIAIDNVLNTIIEDVSFRTAINTTSTTTYGLVSSGIGISIRGTGGGIESGDTNLCENIQIHRCKFDSLYIGVEGTGTVVRPVITDNVFSNLDRGVSLYAADRHLGPTNGLITHNRFKSVVREAIFVGTSTNKSMHVSENNYFVQVGNGRELDDHTTTSSTATSVITFYSEGNKTINDYFHRRTVANSTTNAAFYYYPLIQGKAIIDDTSVFTATIGTYTSVTHGIQNLMKIGLTGDDQMVTVRYQIHNDVLSRKGNIIINVGSSNTLTETFASLTDTYNFNSSDLIIEEEITTSTGVLHGPTQFVVSLDDHPNFRDVIGVNAPYPGTPLETDGTWFLVDVTDNNNAAQITYFNTSSGAIAVFDTQSAPVMTFDNLKHYTLARAVASPIVIDVNTALSTTTNYVTLFARNDSTSTATISSMEFNINILQ